MDPSFQLDLIAFSIEKLAALALWTCSRYFAEFYKQHYQILQAGELFRQDLNPQLEACTNSNTKLIDYAT